MPPTPRRPTLAVTTGDPGGIGPEVIVKALADPGVRERARWVILGPRAALDRAATAAGLTPRWHTAAVGDPWPDAFDLLVLDHPAPPEALRPEPTAAGGELSYRLVEDAIALTTLPRTDHRRAHGLVTAPISKTAWHLAGRTRFPGHTELLAHAYAAPRHAMLFVSPTLRVILATTHIPLAKVPAALTMGRVLETITLGHEACLALGVAHPRLAVCGLNPHAGERGLLGDEDDRLIAPAIVRARDASIDATGPPPADTVFTAAAAPPHGRGRYDLVVAMYHDQGLIPVKLLAWDKAVNVTTGLPAVRTSPDHGTAYDIAGRNLADPGSMAAAMTLAAALAARTL